MSTLSPAQLEQMRSHINLYLLPDTAVIQDVTNTSDGAGGWSEVWQAVSGGTVSCRVDPPGGSGREMVAERLARETTLIMYQFTTEYDAPIEPGQRVVTGGNTYEVLQLDAQHSWNVSKRAIIGLLD